MPSSAVRRSPSDEQQWEIEDLSHFMYLLLETPRDNLLFRSPVESPKYILDVGTGSGTWALDAAEKFPDGLPPLQCIMESS